VKLQQSLNRFTFLVWGLSVCGCGGDVASGILEGGAGNASLPISSSAKVVAGRVDLGVPVAGAQVTAYTLEGDILGQVNAGPTGTFLFRQPMPPHFRLVARFSSQTLSTEVRHYDGQGLYAPINVPTSLVSLAAGNDLDLQVAEQRVRTILGVPSGTSLATGIEESKRAPFSHLKYLVESANSGGPAALAQQLISQNRTHPFRLDGFALKADTSGLSPDLQSIVTRLRQRRGVRLSALGKVSGKTLLLGGVAKDLGDLVWEGLTGNIRDTATNALWTWTAEQLGFHYGTGPELDEILNGLLEIQSDLSALDTKVAQAQFVSEFKAVNTTVDSLNLLLQKNRQAAQQLGYDPTTGQGSNLSGFRASNTQGDSIADFISEVGNYLASVYLATLQRYSLGLEGNSNLVLGSFTFWSQSYGLDQPNRFGNFPVRSNPLLEEALQCQAYLDGYQQLSLNYLVENAHSGVGVASKIASTQLELSRAQALQLKSRQQAPPLLVSDEILVDLENGLMWSLKAPAYSKYDDAVDYASTFNVTVNNVTLNHWRLPTKNECIALQQRGRFVAHSQWPLVNGAPIDTPVNSMGGEGDTGTALRGLSALGFDGLNAKKTDSDEYIFDTKGSFWYNDYSTPNGPDQGPWRLTKYQEFHLNLQNDNTNGEDSTKERPFFLCRSLGTVPLLLPGTYGYNGDQNAPNLPDPSIPTDWTMDGLQDAEFPSLGSPTALGNVTLASGAIDLPVSFRVNLGGSFQYTQGSGSGGVTPATPLSAQAQPNSYDRTLTGVVSQIVAAFSSNNSRVLVRNTVGTSYGQVQFQNHGASAAVVNATIAAEHIGGLDTATGFFPVTLSRSSVLNSPSAVAVRSLQSLLILPGNQQYVLPAQSARSDLYQILGFYDDQSVVDLSTNCTLTITDNSTGQPVNSSGAHFVNANPYVQLNLQSSFLQNSTLNVTATYNGVSNSTLLNITLP
jgi:hypothetical protein